MTKNQESVDYETSEGDIRVTVDEFNKVLKEYKNTIFFKEELFICKNQDNVEEVLETLESYSDDPSYAFYSKNVKEFWDKYSFTKEFRDWTKELFDEFGVSQFDSDDFLTNNYQNKLIWFYMQDIAIRILTDLVDNYRN